jgi:hypothetical protein
MSNTTVPVGTQIPAPNGQLPPGTTMQMQNEWAISTDQEYVLIAQSDGNLVLYEVIGQPPTPNGSFVGKFLWATFTNDQDAAYFVVETDGNLEVYNQSGDSIWASNTVGDIPVYLAIQTDGNLALYVATVAWAEPNAVQQAARGAQAVAS